MLLSLPGRFTSLKTTHLDVPPLPNNNPFLYHKQPLSFANHSHNYFAMANIFNIPTEMKDEIFGYFLNEIPANGKCPPFLVALAGTELKCKALREHAIYFYQKHGLPNFTVTAQHEAMVKDVSMAKILLLRNLTVEWYAPEPARNL
jgi:hypothetical protein